MKNLILIVTAACLSFLFSGCDKSGCDNCMVQKREFCLMMMQVNCNSAVLTTNIDYLVQACGQEEANNYISATTQSCTNGTLVCPEECQ
ncbi:MAG TPA: hypothetical protein PKI01_07790 [Bacteroidales bacterium]|nr:hypothetical protein [Bacteroidales bacterium]